MTQIPHIVVPTDFSDAAAAVIPMAQQFAATFHRPIRLVHVLNPLEAEMPWVPASAETAMHDRLTELETSVSSTGLPVTSTVRRGFAAREILDELETGTSMVVLGVTGVAGAKHRLFGSVSAKVLRASPVAVLTVRKPELGEETRPVRRVLVAVDFSELATGALDDALEVARGFDATVDMVHVLRPPELPSVRGDLMVAGMVPTVTVNALEEVSRIELDKLSAHARAAGAKLGSVLLREGEPVEVLVDHIRSTDPDLVIMSAHGRRGFSWLLLGSVTEQVVMRSERPVLVLKPRRTFLEVTAPSELG